MTNRSVFAKYVPVAYPFRWEGSLEVHNIAGGIPTDPNVAEAWLKTKLVAKDDLIREAVAEVMAERGVSAEEATKLVADTRHLNGFKRDGHGLYIEGRQLKAAIKEAASVAVASGKLLPRGWGKTNKGLVGFVAEHVVVVEETLSLGVSEPTGVVQRFIKSFRGVGIQYEEYVEKAHIDFTIATDYLFADKEWALIWLTGEQQGIGASRSQGYGRYTVTRWERVDKAARKAAREAA